MVVNMEVMVVVAPFSQKKLTYLRFWEQYLFRWNLKLGFMNSRFEVSFNG